LLTSSFPSIPAAIAPGCLIPPIDHSTFSADSSFDFQPLITAKSSFSVGLPPIHSTFHQAHSSLLLLK
jgi:hypothetical protein